MAPRKVRLATNLIKGMDVKAARTQLSFLAKKAAEPLLKLLNSAVANAKHNFSLDENNLFIQGISVDGGPSLKRWLPRAMGRATPLLKRTSHVGLTLEEKKPSQISLKEKIKEKKLEKRERSEEVRKIGEPERGTAVEEAGKEENQRLKKQMTPDRPFGASDMAKKRPFSRQTFGNLKKGVKKLFRRKSV